MNKRGDLIIPFALILSLFALMLGALAGNSVGRRNQSEKRTSVLDVSSSDQSDLQTQK